MFFSERLYGILRVFCLFQLFNRIERDELLIHFPNILSPILIFVYPELHFS